MQCDAAFEVHIDVLKPAATAILLLVTSIAEELHFDEIHVFALFKNKNYNVRLCIEVASNTLRPTVSASNACV